ncbi:hypothetical protein N0V87_003072 [Didymella glomerata]|uniref:Uncharacterized protein n=1 Tax=Didymella glomerata TaxID=749621 RepID=A0A9W9C1R5_9PLEO|nr:hypothetical protein N0V87_003072 [Didymella glomerata]
MDALPSSINKDEILRRNASSAPDQLEYLDLSQYQGHPVDYENIPTFAFDGHEQQIHGSGVPDIFTRNYTVPPTFEAEQNYSFYPDQASPFPRDRLSVAQANSPVQLSYTSLEHAEAGASTLHYRHAWQPPAGIPETQQDCILWVSELLTAMLDISSCRDDPTKNTFKRRWASKIVKTDHGPILERNTYYRIEAIELTCWKLFHLTVNLHTYGTRALGVHDDEALNVTQVKQRLTFDQRIYAICELLRLSKERCNKLLKGEFLAMTVACPINKIKEVKNDAHNNGNRQVHLRMGREEW